MWFAFFIGLALVAATPPHELTLRVGQPVPFTPGALPAQVICDDLSVVRVQDAGRTLQLTGLRPGSTLCSFGTPAYSGRRILYRFNVVP